MNPFHRCPLYDSGFSGSSWFFSLKNVTEWLSLEGYSGGHLAQPPLRCILQALELVACQFKGAQVYMLPPVCPCSFPYVSLGACLSPV